MMMLTMKILMVAFIDIILIIITVLIIILCLWCCYYSVIASRSSLFFMAIMKPLNGKEKSVEQESVCFNDQRENGNEDGVKDGSDDGIDWAISNETEDPEFISALSNLMGSMCIIDANQPDQQPPNITDEVEIMNHARCLLESLHQENDELRRSAAVLTAVLNNSLSYSQVNKNKWYCLFHFNNHSII